MNTARQTIRLLSMASAITFFMFGRPIPTASVERLKSQPIR